MAMNRLSTVAFALGAALPVTGLSAQDTPPGQAEEFHQGVRYRIEAMLDEATDVLQGRARLRYVNRSPFTLDTLWIQQHLNAFRPNSAWARWDLAQGTTAFQDLAPEEHAFERLTRVTVGDDVVRPVYPGAPDSTVAGLPLPRALQPGDSVIVTMDWDARLSTEPRRQGRRGRHYDWAQWYPRVAVVDRGGWQTNPLIRPGEFYGEFGAYDVTLELSADQVVGATGVPVEGDPGWVGVAAYSGPGVPLYRREAYGPVRAAESLGLLDGEPRPDRKRVRFRAENVHHFGWSASPDFIYEGGVYADSIAVHVLYQPGDTAWDDGQALVRTKTALAWLEHVFGPYPWPQLTDLHRIESGGTEFPMLMMNGSPSQGLRVHEGAHQYAHGILANNEWRDAWLDEGMASFVTNWFWESQGREDIWDTSIERIREWERAAASEPVSTHAAEFRDYATYSRMSYTKGSLILLALRELIGPGTFLEGLRAYYRDNAFTHVQEEDLKAAMEAASGRDLDWFFEQWLHTTKRLDYGIGDVHTEELPDGRWRTLVEVLRLGEAWMPVVVRAGDEAVRLDDQDRRQVAELVTPERPSVVELGGPGSPLDFDPTNDRREL